MESVEGKRLSHRQAINWGIIYPECPCPWAEQLLSGFCGQGLIDFVDIKCVWLAKPKKRIRETIYIHIYREVIEPNPSIL